MAPPRNVQLVVSIDRLAAFNSELTKEPRTFHGASVWKSLKPMAEENGVSLFAWIYRDGRGVWQITAAPQKSNENSWPQQLVAGKGFFSSYSKDLPDPTEVQEWLLFESGQFQKCPPGIVDCFSEDRGDSNDYTDGSIDGGEENGSIAEPFPTAATSQAAPTVQTHPREPSREQTNLTARASQALVKIGQIPLKKGGTLVLASGSPLAFVGDALVNATNEKCSGNEGVDKLLNDSGGPNLVKARKKLGACDEGCANITPSYLHTHTKFIIHAVGPDYGKLETEPDPAEREEWRLSLNTHLFSAYRSAMCLARDNECKTVGFCLLTASQSQSVRGDEALETLVENGVRALQAFGGYPGLKQAWIIGGSAEEAEVLERIAHIYSEADERVAAASSPPSSRTKYDELRGQLGPRAGGGGGGSGGGGGGGAQQAAEEYWTKQKADEEAGEKLAGHLALQLDQEEANDRAKASQAAAALQTAAAVSNSSHHHEEAPPPSDHRAQQNNTHWSQPQLVAHFQRSQYHLEVLGCVPLPPPLEDTATTVQKGGRKQQQRKQQQQASPHGAPPPCLVLAGGSVVDFVGDAMVNAANEGCVSGGALDAAVNQAGGRKLMEERAKLGGCRTGCAKYTKSFNHKKTKFIIHAVGPRFPFDSDVTNYAHGHPANYNAAAAGRRRGSGVEPTLSVKDGTILLAQAVTSCLEVAKDLTVQTLGCCLLSAGVFRGSVPLHTIVQIAANTLYAGAYPGLREVWLVAYSPEERHVLRAIAQELMADDALPPSSALAQPSPPPAYATSTAAFKRENIVPPSSSSPSSPSKERTSCVICLDCAPTHCLVPCGHKALCSTCNDASKYKQCPLCKADVQMTMRIFE